MFDATAPAHVHGARVADTWATWARDTSRKIAAGQDVFRRAAEAQSAAGRGQGAARAIHPFEKALMQGATARRRRHAAVGRIHTASCRAARGPRARPAGSEPLPVWVDQRTVRPSRAHGTSFSPAHGGRQTGDGTLRDVIAHFSITSQIWGFDVLYFPRSTRFGTTNAQGPQHIPEAEPRRSVGSPYAIGAPEGGMDAVQSELGTLEGFSTRWWRRRGGQGMEIRAADIQALNASRRPSLDSEEHPTGFERQPHGNDQVAENPPKK